MSEQEKEAQDKTILGNMEVIKHIHQVRKFLYRFIEELDTRAREHDQSKLEEPEAELLGKYTPELAKVEYGSEEYDELLEKVQPAIDHHYANNRHHPQHWPEGVNDMNLIDLVEMFCDWKASSQRNKNGNIRKSVEINAKRFNMSDQLTRIFENTVRDMFNGND